MSLTLIIVGITFLISYRAFQDQSIFEKLAHFPYAEYKQKEYIRMLTGGFVHANWTHLLINMFVLWQFGEIVENAFVSMDGPMMGRINYLLLYILGILAGSLPTYFKHKENPGFRSVGASGAVSGLVFAFILIAPWEKLLLFFIIPVPAVIGGLLFLLYSHYAANNTDGRIDHVAHYYGAVFGLLFTLFLHIGYAPFFWEQFMAGLPF